VIHPTADRTRRPASGDPRPLVLPSFEAIDTATDLDVRFARRTGVPEVSLRLVLEAGAGGEPAELGGLAELTARLVTEGTADRDAQSMARWLDRIGAAVDASAGYAVSMISAHLLTDVLDEALDYLAAIVRSPSFPSGEVDRVRGERLDEIDRQLDDPAVVAGQALIRELYGTGLYGRPAGGTRDSVATIERDDVTRFHAERFVPGGALLIACGDVEPDRFADGIASRFAGWAGDAAPPPIPTTPTPGKSAVVLLDRPDSPQAEIRVGTVGVPYGTSDHYAIILANAILGGLFNSRINMNLREDKGWTYGARSSFRFRRGAGPFTVQTAVETPVTADAFEEILGEIDRMRTEPVGDEELLLAKNALTLSLPLQFETASQITEKTSRARIYGLGDDYWATFRGRIEAVGAEDVLEVCRTYLGRDRLLLLAVTDAQAVHADLQRLGPVDLRPA